MTTPSPIPDNIRPIIAIGSVLPPFSLVFLAFLWNRLHTDLSTILPLLGYCSFTLAPFFLNSILVKKYRTAVLPGETISVSLLFWAVALAPVAVVMHGLAALDLQIALILPLILISGFGVSALCYLVLAIALGAHQQRRVAASE